MIQETNTTLLLKHGQETIEIAWQKSILLLRMRLLIFLVTIFPWSVEISAFWCLGLRKTCSSQPLGKYKSQELGALSTVFVKQELLLVGRGRGGVRLGREGARSAGARNPSSGWEWPRRESRSLLGPCRSALLDFPCPTTAGSTQWILVTHTAPNKSGVVSGKSELVVPKCKT